MRRIERFTMSYSSSSRQLAFGIWPLVLGRDGKSREFSSDEIL